jgi:diaminopimelate decarboxylase
MNHFVRKGGALLAEGVSLERLAEQVGTPAYVYSRATLERHVRVLRDAFHGPDRLICYSVKASSNLALLRLFAQRGLGFDIVSGGELQRVLKAGGAPSRVVFSGVGKTKDEMAAALNAGILMFNVESAAELLALDAVGRRLGRRAPFSLRVNPDVDARTHRYIATGLKTSKFGVPFAEALELYHRARRMTGVKAIGLDCHIGSQLTELAPVREAVKKVAGLFRALNAEGLGLTHLDVGGGIGIRYTHERPPTLEAWAHAVLQPLRGLGATLVLEPGRVIVGNAALLLTRVLYLKRAPHKSFVIVDAGMNDLLRPALYEAHHDIVPVRPRKGRRAALDVVGPVCESADVLGAARRLPPLEPGDLLAVMTAGAYGMSMSSTYNSRPRPAEVLVDGRRFRVVRRRETTEDLWRGES